VGVVTDATRPSQHLVRTTLADLDPDDVGMLSIVLVGSTTTAVVGDHVVTPRGYDT
jgi:precorrin-3B methylase